MTKSLIRRAVMLMVVLLGVSALSFALSAVSPMDPAETFARERSGRKQN